MAQCTFYGRQSWKAGGWHSDRAYGERGAWGQKRLRTTDLQGPIRELGPGVVGGEKNPPL